MILLVLLACLYCDLPDASTAQDPWRDRDRIPATMVFPPAERRAVEQGYPWNLRGKSGNLRPRDWINDHGREQGDEPRHRDPVP